MQYEQHVLLRVAIERQEPETRPARTVMGISVEDSKVFTIASTNARETAAVIRYYVEDRCGWKLDTHGMDPARTTSFTVKYDEGYLLMEVHDELLEVITKVNKRPRRLTQIRPTRYPAGTVRV